ncbi:MAG TPA: ATP-binding protein [Fibrobacteria bacterium]|nr:ATP-binding protein [Fibrobacteria bacterium]
MERLFDALLRETELCQIALLDAETRFVRCNRGLGRLLGWTEAELAGTFFSEHFRLGHPHAPEGAALKDWLLRNGNPTLECEFRSGTGGTLRAKVFLSSLREYSGEVRGFGLVLESLSPKLLFETVSGSPEAHFSKAFKAASDGLAISTLEEGIVLEVNDSWQAITGYSRDEIVGGDSRALRLVDPAERREVMGLLESRGRLKDHEIRLRNKAGAILHVQVSIEKIELDGTECLMTTIRDVSKHKRVQEALREMNEALEKRVRERTIELARAKEAMERSNMELKQFACIASHDLQGPLRSISGFAQLLSREYADKLDDRGKDWIRRTVESARDLQALIHDLLAYSKVEYGGRPFAATDCNLAFDDAVAMLEAPIRAAGATVSRNHLPVIHGDRSQMAQLFMNLISNGIKYRGEKPPAVHASSRREENVWIMSVRDNGIGIAPRNHAKIFEIFRRLHARRAYPGTGIGLAVCRKVVDRHGGILSVESTLGNGAEFIIAIPDLVAVEAPIQEA